MPDITGTPGRLFLNVNSIFHKHSKSATGNAQRSDPQAKGSLEQRMVESFKGQIRGGEFQIGNRDHNRHLILRQGQAGLLNLTSFQAVVRVPNATPGSSGATNGTSSSTNPIGIQGGQPTISAASNPSSTTSLPPGPPPDPDKAIGDHIDQVHQSLDGALATLRTATARKEAELGKWYNALHVFKGGREAVRLEAAARGDALKLASDALKQLDVLAAKNPHGPGHAERQEQIAQARQDVLLKLLTAQLGGGWDVRPMPRETQEAIHDAAAQLLALHDKMCSAGAEGYGIDKLVSALSQFGRIVEFGRSTGPQQLQMAAEGLAAVASSVLEALAPPRDGVALNALSGIQPELDKAIKALRIDATTQVLVEAHKRKGDGSGPDAAELARLKGVATKVVTDEMALAEPRRQIGRVLEKAGVPLNGASLQGVRIDGNLISAIRAKLGPDTHAAGLIMAGLLMAERSARGSAEALELRAAMEEIRSTASGGDARALDERIGSLGDEVTPLRNAMERAQRNLQGVQTRIAELHGSIDDLVQEETRLLGPPPLEDGGRLDEIRAAIDEQREELGKLRERLPWLENAARATKQDHDTRAHDLTTQRDKLGYLSDKEIALLDLKSVQSFAPEKVSEAAAKLAKRGLASAQQAHDLAETVNRTMEKIGIAERYKTAVIRSQEENYTSGRPMDEARRLQDRLLLKLTGQVESFQHRPGSVQSAMQSATQAKGLHAIQMPANGRSPETVPGGDPALIRARQDLAGLATRYDDTKQVVLNQISAGVQPTKVVALYRILDERRAKMGEETHAALRDTLRAAILQVQQSQKSPVDKFDPAQQADAIRGLLTQWGVDIAAFRPEIDVVLSQSFGEVELALWMKDAPERPSGPMPTDSTAPSGVPQEMFREKSAAASLLRSFDNLSNGSKIRLTATGGVEVTTGSIPLEPTGTASLTLKGGADSVGMFEIAQGSDGIEIILSKGWQGRGGVEVTANLMGHISKAANDLGFRAGVSAGIEGGGARLHGAVLKFENTVEGRQAARHMVEALVDGRPLAPIDLAEAEIRPVVESRGAFKANVGARFGWESPELAIGASFKATAMAKIGTGYSLSTKQTVAENLNQRVVKTETGHMIDLTGSVSVGVKSGLAGVPWTANEKGETKSWGPSADLIDIGGQKVMWSITTKSKIVQAPGGQVEKSSNLERLAQPAIFGELRGAAALGGPILERMMDPPQDLPPEKLAKLAALREQIKQLASLARGGDQIVVSLSLRESVRESANAMLSEANALREGRIPSASTRDAERRAEELENQALAMIKDEDNYLPSKVMLLSGSDMKSSITALNLFLVRVQEGIEDKREGYTAEITLPPDLVAEFDRGPGKLPPRLPPLPNDSDLRPRLSPGDDVSSSTDDTIPGSGRQSGSEHVGDQRQSPEVRTGSRPTEDLSSARGVPGPDMFVQYQTAEECGVCSINALVGREVVTPEMLQETARTLNPQGTTESAATGFEVMTVASHLEMLRSSGEGLTIGGEPVRISQARHEQGQWVLPDIPPTTDRLVLFERTREDDVVHNHFVAFRKDDAGDWWLLDSRNPGKGEPKRQRITPQEYAEGFGAKLQMLQVIGSGIGGIGPPVPQ